MRFGLPYQGSKSSIAKDIVAILPGGKRLVDLFCGGCSVTDYAMKKTDKFNRFLINDIDGRNAKTYIRAPEDFISIWCKEKRRLFNHRVMSANAVEHLFLHKKFTTNGII